MKTYRLSSGKTVTRPRSFLPLALSVLAAMFCLSVIVTGFDLKVLAERGGQFFVIIGEMFPPDFSYASDIWGPLLDTVKMSLLGSLIGSVAAIPFAVFASTNIIQSRVLIAVMRLFLGIVRTIPTLIMALIATFAFGLGTMAGTAAIAVFTFAYVGKTLYEQIETVDMGAFEAMEAMGANKARAFTLAVVPQVMPSYLSICLFCFEGNVRYASILGYVGAGGLGLLLNEKIGWRQYSGVGMILILLFLAVLAIESLSQYLRRRLAKEG